MSNKFLDSYYANNHHTQKERAKYRKYMERQYAEYLKKYHDLKIRYRSMIGQKLSFSYFKKMFENDYIVSRDVREVKKTLLGTDKFLRGDIYTDNLQNYIKSRETNFMSNLKRIREAAEKGIVLNPAEQLILDVYEERKKKHRGFLWMYERALKLGEERGIEAEQIFDYPEEIEEE